MREIVQVIEDDDDVSKRKEGRGGVENDQLYFQDCIVMGSSSESSDGIDDVTEVVSLMQ